MVEKKQDSTSLFKKLLEVKKSVSYLQKVAQGSQYKYTSSSQVLTAVRDKMNEVGLILTCEVVDKTLHSNLDEKGRMNYFTELGLIMTWVDTETGQELKLGWYGQGVDLGGEKGVGKALTYAEKYFILKQFNIPTDKDDPDAFQEKNQTEETKAQDRAQLKAALIAKVDACKNRDELTPLWTNSPDLQADAEFKAAVMAKTATFPKKTKTDAATTDGAATAE